MLKLIAVSGYCLVGLLYATLYYVIHLRKNPDAKELLLGVVALAWPIYLALDAGLGLVVGAGRLIKWTVKQL